MSTESEGQCEQQWIKLISGGKKGITEYQRWKCLHFIIKTHPRGRGGSREWKEHKCGRTRFSIQFWY